MLAPEHPHQVVSIDLVRFLISSIKGAGMPERRHAWKLFFASCYPGTMAPSSFGKRVHGEIEGSAGSVRDEVLAIVNAIPRGKVVNYGWISRMMNSRISPLAVGWMLHRCPDGVPWHRVVNASGRCSTDRTGDIPQGLQRAMLEGEGVVFRLDQSLDLKVYLWNPDDD